MNWQLTLTEWSTEAQLHTVSFSYTSSLFSLWWITFSGRFSSRYHSVTYCRTTGLLVDSHQISPNVQCMNSTSITDITFQMLLLNSQISLFVPCLTYVICTDMQQGVIFSMGYCPSHWSHLKTVLILLQWPQMIIPIWTTHLQGALAMSRRLWGNKQYAQYAQISNISVTLGECQRNTVGRRMRKY